jgi:molybdopterin converting factor small subunit
MELEALYKKGLSLAIMVTILLPSLLSKVTGEKKVALVAKTLGEALDKLVEIYGMPLKNKMFDGSGNLNRFLNFYLKGRMIPPAEFTTTPLEEDDEVSILVVISGG